MPTKTNRKSITPHAKRKASHHKTSKHYLKVYWPYVPITLIVAVGLFFGNHKENAPPQQVLAYATEVSNQQLLTATNQKRVEDSKAPLKLNQTLSAAAQAKANDMVAKNYWSHYTPTGAAPWMFIDNAGYKYTKAGENLAYGFATSKDTVTGWMNSPTHKANMLDGSFTEVGFGFANAKDFNKSGEETIIVAMYGQPSGEQTPAVAAASSSSGFTTNSAGEPTSKAVAFAQSLTAGSAPWITFAVGLMSGALLLFVFAKHGLAIRKAAFEGEQFVVHHPFLDIAFVGLVMIGYVLSQTNGFIR